MRLPFAIQIVLLLLIATPLQADEARVRDEILTAFQAVTEAFQLQDRSAIEALTTKDHIAITSYYNGAKGMDFQLSTASDLIFTQKPISEMHVETLGQDVALLRFTAEMSGSFKGQALPSKAEITILWQKVEGKWLERLYQETPLD